MNVGDKFKANNYLGVWTVLAVDGQDVWGKNEKGNRLTFNHAMVVKLPDFFEVGKTYRGVVSTTKTFDCHYVGWFGNTLTGKKYAAGQVNYKNGEIYSISTARFDDWTEI